MYINESPRNHRIFFSTVTTTVTVDNHRDKMSTSEAPSPFSLLSKF